MATERQMEKNRKHVRLNGFDYGSNGYYFITICSSGRQCNCSKYQEIIERHLKGMENHDGVSIDHYILMPDHVHFIILLQEAKLPLSRLVQEFKSKTTIEIKKNGYNEKKFWQPNYYEHVLRSDKELKNIREYITNNPKAESPRLIKKIK